MSINPKILAKLGRDGDGVALEGTPKQVEWAKSIRATALALVWPDNIRYKLTQIKDATWWIANKAITRTLKYKEPDPKQLASSCSPSTPGVNGQSESSPPAPAAPPSEDYIDAMTPLNGAPRTIPPRTEAAQRQIDRADKRQADLEERVSDAEKWAESVSHNPKLAESAILAVLSRLYKDPMKSRLRTMAWMKLGEAQCVFAKDEDAIRRMLEVP